MNIIGELKTYRTIAQTLARSYSNHIWRRERMVLLYRMIELQADALEHAEGIYEQSATTLRTLLAILNYAINTDTLTHHNVKTLLYLFVDVCSFRIADIRKTLPKAMFAAVAVDDIPF